MLTVRNVTKRYGKNIACQNVSFTVEDGETAILLGPNGAGKSTLLKSVIGFLRFEGEIDVDGHPCKSPQAKRLLGYVPEMPSFYPNLTVAEHLEFIARVYRLTDYKQRANELLERFELSDKRKKFGDELSKGMCQKLSICCALLPNPKTVLFDEPMVGLDPHAIKELRSLFGEITAQGGSLLISTHMIDSVESVWDHALIMQKSLLLADVRRGTMDEKGERLEDLFFELTESRPPEPERDGGNRRPGGDSGSDGNGGNGDSVDSGTSGGYFSRVGRIGGTAPAAPAEPTAPAAPVAPAESADPATPADPDNRPGGDGEVGA